MVVTKPSAPTKATPAPAPAVAKTVTPTSKSAYVTPVYGAMYNPHQGIHINGRTLVPEIDSWSQSQIDAGKLTRE